MLFSSMIFLWLFLPFVLVVNLVLPIRLSNLFLLAMSFIFYAWGEQEYIWLLLLSLAELRRRHGDGGCAGQRA